MDQTDERRANKLPDFLVYTTMVLVIARLGVSIFELHFNPMPIKTQPSVAWINLNKLINRKINLHKISSQKLMSTANATDNKTPFKSENLETEISSILNEKAKTKDLILFEFYSPESDPALRMEENALSNSQVTSFLKNNFTPVRVNYRRDNSTEMVKVLTDFRRGYRVCAYPTLVVTNTRGEMIANLIGNCSSLTTYRFLTRTLACSQKPSVGEKLKMAIR